jgi:cytochrome bd ubiquinol oxidase subunit II
MPFDLHVFWFILLGVLLAGYGILDGFDLGVGILHPLAKTDAERRALMSSIGPIWDGNEVWLVVFGGALFAAFPNVYAAALTGFYIPFMLMLVALIFRAVSMEFRSKKEARWWRSFWDFAFFGSSTLATFIFGLAVGCTLSGLPIDASETFSGTLADLIKPYHIMVGVFAVSVCAMHGSIYLYLKMEGEFQKRVRGWMWTTFGIFIACYMLTTIMTLVLEPHATANFKNYPISWLVVILNVLAIANIPRAIYMNKPLYAFVSSSCSIAAFTFLFGVALFPNLLVSTLNHQWNLTIYNASSSPQTLTVMAIIAALGMPFVLTYTAVVYWVFRGKVKMEEMIY